MVLTGATARQRRDIHDTIQPFPSFSEIHAAALMALRGETTTALSPATTT